MEKKVYVCGTLFHVFISTLKSNFERNKGVESLLIVNDHTPCLEDIAKKLVSEGFFTNYLFVPFIDINIKYRSEENYFRKFFSRNKTTIRYVERDSNIKQYHDFINNSTINLFYNLGFSSTYFLIRFKENEFNQVEDGFRNYNPNVSNLKALKRKLLGTPQGEGRDPQIKTIEVQFPEKLPKIVRNKGVKLDISELTKSLPTENRQKLLDIFLQGHTFEINGHKKAILITQPLSEDKFITEDYKIELYRKIIIDYAKDYDVYIKPHPRETTDYKGKIGTNIVEIPRNFPMEILNFYPDIVFEKGITIYSGALNNLVNIKERIFLGHDYDKKIIPKKKLL